MKFSIVTPAYNGMPQLKCCVGSVRGQSEAQYEHIIQDGGSSDGTIEWLSAQPDLNICSTRDNGMYDAINRGWSRATGDVLSWLNADEQYLPGTLTFVQSFFNEHPDADVVFGNAIIINSNGQAIAARREIPLRGVYVRNGFLYALSCTLFFRRSLWDEGLLRFDTSYRYAGDGELILRLLDRGVKFRHANKYFSLFGVDGRNLSVSPNMEAERKSLYVKYRAFPFCPLRKAVMFARYAERLFAGCYRKSLVNYSYALNQIPEYRYYPNVKLGFRFTYGRFLNGRKQQHSVSNS
jgi:glycosyltransferase involved in cell wall biosynthesis